MEQILNQLPYTLACEFLVSSDTGSGSIVSAENTKYMEGAVDCDWVIVGKPSSSISLKFNSQTSRSDESLDCSECSADDQCCNFVEVIDGENTERYCCGKDMPEKMDRSENAVILRLRLDESAQKSRGFSLDWEESK